MKFDIDKQTINDLELFEKIKVEKSVFSLFNYTKSIGGKNRLEYLFSNPLTDIDSIENRIEIIRFFKENNDDFEIYKECLDFVEYYLSQQNIPDRYSISKSFINAFIYTIKPDNEFYIIRRGIRFLIDLLYEIYNYALNTEEGNTSEFLKISKQKILDKFNVSSLKAVLQYKKRKKLYPFEFGKLDYCFRRSEIKNVRELLEIIYEIEVFKSIAFAANKHGFTLPDFTKDSNKYDVRGLFHPFINNPVSNDFEYVTDKNVCFLTGPNMAGKSTFMKAISISVYLSHLGFPVPAKYMRTSLFNGLLTTINLSDNINKGYSHFYNEVLRVKFVAERINISGNIFVVFDELFRGTNVKDAYEASLAVISSFSKLNSGVFAISTHIIEIADKLNGNLSIFYKCFEAKLIDDVPQYKYKIKDGVTNERIGIYILKKEKVIETIENAI